MRAAPARGNPSGRSARRRSPPAEGRATDPGAAGASRGIGRLGQDPRRGGGLLHRRAARRRGGRRAGPRGGRGRGRPHVPPVAARRRGPRGAARLARAAVRHLRGGALGQARQVRRAGEARGDRRLQARCSASRPRACARSASSSTRRATAPRTTSASPNGSARPSPTTRAMLEDVLAALFQIARADGPLTRAEVAFLQGTQLRFGLDARAWERARDGRAQQRRLRAGGAAAAGGPDPYAVLGLTRDAPDADVRAGVAAADAGEPPGQPRLARRAAGVRQARDGEGRRHQRRLGPHQARARSL